LQAKSYACPSSEHLFNKVSLVLQTIFHASHVLTIIPHSASLSYIHSSYHYEKDYLWNIYEEN